MYVLLTLNEMGNDLGFNFSLSADTGTVSPTTVTKLQLLNGVDIVCDDLATEITITSLGTCTNSLTLTIDTL